MAPAVRVVGLDHIVLLTPDVERTLQFYTQVLGLAGERVEEWRAGQVPFPSVRIDAATLIDLMLGERSGENLAHFCLVIEPTDLAAITNDPRLSDATAPSDGMFGARGFASSVYVRDPDGNTIELRTY